MKAFFLPQIFFSEKFGSSKCLCRFTLRNKQRNDYEHSKPNTRKQ